MSKTKLSRTFVNLYGIPLVMFILWAGDIRYYIPIYSLFILLILLVSASEYSNFITFNKSNPSFMTLKIFIIITQLFRYLDNINILHDLQYMMYIVIFMILVLFFIELINSSQASLYNIMFILFGYIWICMMLGSLSLVRNFQLNNIDIGYQLTLVLFLSIWCCDTFAYFFGKNFGEKKIMPSISPNKTWIGSIAGLFGSLIVWLIFYKLNLFSGIMNFNQIIIISIIIGFFGQLGDFSESLLKRNAKIKDASQILKGHGGVLDRFDSLAFATPMMYIYLKSFIF
tara:strand:- start:7291 stop:8145 length:855 start_codon:yes stop_codon:yes gene_type:complete